MTVRFGRVAAAAISRRGGWQSDVIRKSVALGAPLGDGVLLIVIVTAGIIGWSPKLGLAAARETIAARRQRRRELAEIGRIDSAIWARQARRNAFARTMLARSRECLPPPGF